MFEVHIIRRIIRGVVKSTKSIARKRLMALARFRLGSHNLRIATGRWNRIARHLRVCDKCGTGAVQDEKHAVLEYPASQHIRDRYTDLFEGQRSIREIFLCEKVTSLIALVGDILDFFC